MAFSDSMEVFVKDEKVCVVAVIIVLPVLAVPDIKVALAILHKGNFRAAAANRPGITEAAADLVYQSIKHFTHGYKVAQAQECLSHYLSVPNRRSQGKLSPAGWPKGAFLRGPARLLRRMLGKGRRSLPERK
jgi:hypothetical protein